MTGRQLIEQLMRQDFDCEVVMRLKLNLPDTGADDIAEFDVEGVVRLNPYDRADGTDKHRATGLLANAVLKVRADVRTEFV